MKSKTKGKFILICLATLISLSFVFGSNVVIYPAKLSEDPVNTSEQNLENPRISTNGAFKIYWKANGTAVTESPEVYYETYSIIKDGEGGAIIAWVEDKIGANRDIYAQKLNSEGVRLWGENGTVICNDTTDNQHNPHLCTDDEGGAIITWTDHRNLDSDIYAQHVDSNGKTHWGDGKLWGGKPDRNGTVICNSTADQEWTRICSDTAKGAIITWLDYRGASGDIYVQHVDSNGNLHWGDGKSWGGKPDRNGTVICNETFSQAKPYMCSDDNGGAIITWRDPRPGGGVESIYAQHINSTGHTQWGDEISWGGTPDRNGTVICNVISTQTEFPMICTDQAGGAIISWDDRRTGLGVANLYAQHVDSNGITHWGDGNSWGGTPDRNGTVICNDTAGKPDYSQLCTDGKGGAIIAWSDNRGATGSVYAQHVDSGGTTHWGDERSWGGNPDRNGTVICEHPDSYPDYPVYLCTDGSGGAIIAWMDDRHPVINNYIYAQHVDSGGTTHWGDGNSWGGIPDRNGTVVYSGGNDAYLNNDEPYPSICSDDNGGAIVAWYNQTPTNDWSMAAQRVRARIPSGGFGLPAGDDDDDDDDDDDTRIEVVLVVIIINVCVGGVVIVIIVLNQKGIIGTSRGQPKN